MKTRMTGILIAALVAIGFAAGVAWWNQSKADAADGPSYTSDGRLKLPMGYRNWVFIGAPITPNGLNAGKAGFPEYHNVYVQQKNLAEYRRTGVFPEGTVIVKELLLLRRSDYPDGSANTPAGRGYSAGRFNGMDVTVKDRKRFANTNGWGFFNFGHHSEPYEATAAAASEAECAGCHRAGAGNTDMTWVDYYPILRAKH